MSLSSLQLDAFLMVLRTGSFSKAASKLFITQSALSQRVKSLEEDLGTVLIVRESKGIRPTAAGEVLLKYCDTRRILEEECLHRIGSPQARPKKELVGTLRVAGFSTLIRSLVLPALNQLAREHPGIRLELMTRELRDLPPLLKKGEADFVFLDRPIERESIVYEGLGDEENVLIESFSKKTNREVFLDHDTEDETTLQFVKLNQKKLGPFESCQREYLGEIYTILDAVALGIGRAVVPRHLALQNRQVRVLEGYHPLRIPVYLNYYKQPYLNSLFKSALPCLRSVSQYLGQRN